MNNYQEMYVVFRSMFLAALRDPEVAHQLWHSANTLSMDYPPGSGFKSRSVNEELSRRATATTARYVERKLLHLRSFPSRLELLDLCLEQAPKEGLYLEFGVFSGRSINYLAPKVPDRIHGFDSFQGLAETQGVWRKGQFSNQGALPKVEANVRLHPGWFDATIPAFLKTHPGPAAFIHLDCDTYQSARLVLELMSERMVAGTVIQFDEYFNYPGWRQGEFLAFQEFIQARGAGYEYLGYVENCRQAAVVLA